MANANELLTHFVKTFEANVIHLVQQKYSKLRGTVTEKSPGPTEKHAFRVTSPRSAAMTARTNVGLVAGKRTTTPFADQVWNDRVVGSTRYGVADSYSEAELVRMLTDPKSVLTTSMAMQIGRQFDDVIIASYFAAALDGQGNSNSFPAGQVLGGATQAPNFDFVRLIREAVLEKDIDPDEEVFLVVSPNFAMAMLDEPQATSADYVSLRALMGGTMLKSYMGFTWILSNRLSNNGVAGPPAQRLCAAYTKDSMGLLVQESVKISIGKDPGTWFDTVIMAECDIGAVRIQDDKVFKVHILETN